MYCLGTASDIKTTLFYFLGYKTRDGQDCVFPFAYNGIYNTCARPDYTKNGIEEYCATSLKPNSGEGLTWGKCNASLCAVGKRLNFYAFTVIFHK